MFITRMVCCMAACCMLRWIFMDMVSGWMGGKGWLLPDSRWLFSLMVTPTVHLRLEDEDGSKVWSSDFSMITTIANRITGGDLTWVACLVKATNVFRKAKKNPSLSWDLPCPYHISLHHDRYSLQRPQTITLTQVRSASEDLKQIHESLVIGGQKAVSLFCKDSSVLWGGESAGTATWLILLSYHLIRGDSEAGIHVAGIYLKRCNDHYYIQNSFETIASFLARI